MTGQHRARWRTPWQSLLGEAALTLGIRGVRHALVWPTPTPTLTVADLIRRATNDNPMADAASDRA